MRLRIITTGGTIDKLYFDARSQYEVGRPQIARILNEVGVAFEYRITELFRKDSLDMTDADRQLLRETIEAADERRFLITHGTDTMLDSARYLGAVENKVMVLTGALNPARFQESDAIFNIGCAVAAVQLLDSGVFIAMNGRIWKPDEVRKNREENRFEELGTL